jgi:hypothetical protein
MARHVGENLLFVVAAVAQIPIGIECSNSPTTRRAYKGAHVRRMQQWQSGVSSRLLTWSEELRDRLV